MIGLMKISFGSITIRYPIQNLSTAAMLWKWSDTDIWRAWDPISSRIVLNNIFDWWCREQNPPVQIFWQHMETYTQNPTIRYTNSFIDKSERVTFSRLWWSSREPLQYWRSNNDHISVQRTHIMDLDLSILERTKYCCKWRWKWSYKNLVHRKVLGRQCTGNTIQLQQQ